MSKDNYFDNYIKLKNFGNFVIVINQYEKSIGLSDLEEITDNFISTDEGKSWTKSEKDLHLINDIKPLETGKLIIIDESKVYISENLESEWKELKINFNE